MVRYLPRFELTAPETTMDCNHHHHHQLLLLEGKEIQANITHGLSKRVINAGPLGVQSIENTNNGEMKKGSSLSS